MISQEFIYELLERKFSVQTAGIHKDSKLRDLGLDSFDIFFSLQSWRTGSAVVFLIRIYCLFSGLVMSLTI